MFNTVTITFFLFIGAFTGVGLWAATRKQETPEDYLLASRNVSPWLTALSAVSTQNSGFMFVGLTGSAYAGGVAASVWMMAGWVIGDYAAWLFIHRRVRETSLEVNTVPGFLGHGIPGGRVVIVLAGLITFAFLGVYAAAQLTAGRKALETFGIDGIIGVTIGAAMVAIYCFSGGIRASIWTDAAQSIVMILAMLLLVVVALDRLGGFSGLATGLHAADPGLTTWFPESYAFGFGPFFFGWIAAGFGVVGQPHIMVRIMAIESPQALRSARRVYMLWFILFSAACILVGLSARVLLPELVGGDAELAFPLLSRAVLPGVLVGVMLAGLFAATISTADSQVLACSAAITQDLVPGWAKSYVAVKAATLTITIIAAAIAIIAIDSPDLSDSVFTLVIFAWSGLASALGPLLVVRAFRLPISASVATTMIAVGLATVLIWMFVLKYSSGVYEALPGLLAGGIIYAVSYPSLCRARHEQASPRRR